MGEKEQGGLLRTVVVIGLIALIAGIIIAGIFSVKSSIRHSTVMATDTGHNLVPLTNNSVSKTYWWYNDAEMRDQNDGEATLLIKGDRTSPAGMFYKGAGSDVYNAFKKLDVWQASVDLKVDDPKGLAISSFGVEGSNNTWLAKPNLSTDWQHFEIKGTRVNQWGTMTLYFTNHSGHDINVHVKNLELYRIG